MTRMLSRLVYLAGWLALAGALTLALGVGGGFIRISQPRPGEKLSGKVTVRAQVIGLKDIAYVIFGVDADKPHSTNAEPYQYELDTTSLSDGPHTLYVEAHGRYGLLASSAPVQVIVANQPSAAPQVLARAAKPKPAPQPAALPQSPKVQPAAVQPTAPAQPAAPPAEPDDRPAPAAPEPMLPLPLLSTPATGIASPQADRNADQPTAAFPAVASASPKIPAATARKPQSAVQPKPVTSRASLARVVSLHPLMDAGRAFVRFRSLAEGIGHKVAWLHHKKTGIATNGTVRIEITADSATALVNGKPFQMAAAAYLHENRLVAPSRSCAEMLDAQIAWDDKARLVRISVNPEKRTEMASR